jgi:hypothetical protein
MDFPIKNTPGPGDAATWGDVKPGDPRYIDNSDQELRLKTYRMACDQTWLAECIENATDHEHHYIVEAIDEQDNAELGRLYLEIIAREVKK